MITNITRAIYTAATRVLQFTGQVHLASLVKADERDEKRVLRSYRKAEMVADAAASLYEDADTAAARAEEAHRQRAAEASKLLGVGI